MGVGSMVSTSHPHAPTHVGDMAECMYICRYMGIACSVYIMEQFEVCI